MPLYEYQCEACSRRFEKIQKFSDALMETCPECGGRVNKMPSSPAIQFKGSGWYITDYAKKASEDGSKAPSGTADKSENTDKSDTTEKSDKSSKSDTTSKNESGGGSSDSTTSKPATTSTE